MANLSHDIEFEEGTISNIGSVTKQFTAMGLLLLQAEGKLSLDDDIRAYVPELPDFGVPITLRNLLNHTGGYREIYNLLPMMGYGGEDSFSRDKAIEIVQRQLELQAQPNTEFNYNNTGYILLATTIERVSGMTYPEYMKAKVFTPLGMTDTRVKAEQGEVIPGSAQGYVPAEDGGYRQVRDLAASYGAGGIYTTVADLAKWMLNYRDATLGGHDAIEAITTKAILESGDSSSYGLGLGIGTFRGRTRYSHTGGDVAHRAYFGYYPELESGVIVLSNNGSFSLGVGTQIALAFFEDEFDPEEDEADTASAGDMSEERMEAIAGDWRIVAPTASLDIVYTVEDGNLHAQATNQPKFQLIPTSDSTVRFEGVPATVTFHFEPNGTVDSATHHQGGDVPMIRVDKVELSGDQLAEFAGRYYSEELETAIEVVFEGDSLVAHNLRMDPFELSHRDGLAFSGGFPFATIEFRRAGNGRITGFMASNGRTRNVWFRAER
jgi:CubicO group peptidase (beta-lactamase class C family)